MSLQATGLIALGSAGLAARVSSSLGARDVRPCAELLEALLAADLLRLAIGAFVLAPARASGRTPFEGAARIAFHASQALYLAWPVGAAVLAVRSFGGDLRVGAGTSSIGTAAIAAVPIAIAYPALRGELLSNTYRGVQLASLAVCLAAVAAKQGGIRIGRGALASLLVIAGIAAELAGPFLKDPFSTWWTAQASWIVVLAAVSVAVLWGRPWATADAS